MLKDYKLFSERGIIFTSWANVNAAVPLAIDECIREGTLAEFLSSQRAEAIAMSIYEYNEENVRRLWKKDAYDEGYDDGHKKGVMEERQNTERERQNAERERLRAEEARKRAEEAEQKVAELLRQLEEMK